MLNLNAITFFMFNRLCNKADYVIMFLRISNSFKQKRTNKRTRTRQ